MILLTFPAMFTAAQAQVPQHVAIVDPVLEMPAWTLTAPAGWKVEGTMLPGSSCVSATSPTYRAVSPDGLAGAYLLPRVDWAWGSAARPGPDCLPLRQPVSAHDYLTSLIRTLGVGFVSDEPVPELAEMRRNLQAQDAQSHGMRHTSGDIARYVVRYEVAGRPVEEWTTATIVCSDAQMLGIGHPYNCSAFATRWFAPSGRLADYLPALQAMKMSVNPQWMNRWTALMTANVNQRSREQTASLLRQGRLAQDARTRQQQGFMDSFRRGNDVHDQQFRDHLYQKQRQSDNFVDQVLDCQRLYGSTSRVSVGNNCPNRQTY